MNLHEAGVAIVQDDPDYLALAKIFFGRVGAQLSLAADLEQGYQLIDDIVAAQALAHVLAIDENLTTDDGSGEDGRALYEYGVRVGLVGQLCIVSISSIPQLSEIPCIGSKVGDLLTYVKNL